MNQDIVKFLCRLESFKTVAKNMHFSAKGTSEHEFFDELSSFLHDSQDEFGEIEQGVHSKFNKKTIKPDGYTCESPKQFIKDIISSTIEVYKKITGDEYIGMRSAIEGFLQKLDKQPYLLDMCLKEDFKRQYKAKLNEAMYGGNVEHFTPYKEGEGYKMWQKAQERTPEERNPAYAAALKKAQARKAAKNLPESFEVSPNELNGAIEEAMHKVIGGFINENRKHRKPSLSETVERVINNYVNKL